MTYASHLSSKLFLAIFTLVGRVSCVLTSVVYKMFLPRKLLLAKFTSREYGRRKINNYIRFKRHCYLPLLVCQRCYIAVEGCALVLIKFYRNKPNLVRFEFFKKKY